jgi:3-oxoacyl-[acyl-carrier protein] reductase
MDLGLSGRIAVVTGASIGIGRGIAKALAAEGAQTVLVARRTSLLEALRDEIVASGGKRPLIVTADLYDRASPERVRDEVFREFGHADILVNDAGGSRNTTLDAPDEVWDESFAINFTAVRKMTHAFLPTMQARKWGRIVNITGSMEPKSFNAANAAKAGVHAWAKGLSRVVAKDGVTVNSLHPGRIHSEQIDKRLHPTPENQQAFARDHIPMGCFGEPEDMAGLAVFLCSPRARYVTGQRIYVDGGLHQAI